MQLTQVKCDGIFLSVNIARFPDYITKSVPNRIP